MAFPVIASVTASSFGTDATAHLVAMPATVDANDLLIVGLANDGSATLTTPRRRAGGRLLSSFGYRPLLAMDPPPRKGRPPLPVGELDPIRPPPIRPGGTS